MARNVVVTGGGTGIGRAIASAFCSAGDSVIITGRRAEPLRATAAELGPSVHTRVCDGTDPGQVATFAAELDRVDVLVNNAGGNTDFDRPDPNDLDDLEAIAASWRSNFDANLLSGVLMTEATRPKLARGGAVISLGSIAADTGSGSSGLRRRGWPRGTSHWPDGSARSGSPRTSCHRATSAGPSSSGTGSPSSAGTR